MSQLNADTTCNNRLDALLSHFSVSLKMIRSGTLCTNLPIDSTLGQLHLIQSGNMLVEQAHKQNLHINEPSLLLYPRGGNRVFYPETKEVNMMCAALYFEGGINNPLNDALPDQICLALSQLPELSSVIEMIFKEGEQSNCGKQRLLDNLLQALFVQLLRYLMENNCIQGGMLAGLAHPKLRYALISIHEQPAQPHSLQSLASVSGMSRSMFAKLFHEMVGCTPGTYLQNWRILLVQKGLLQGKPFKLLVDESGYASEVSLSRAFKLVCGQSPRQWLKSQVEQKTMAVG